MLVFFVKLEGKEDGPAANGKAGIKSRFSTVIDAASQVSE
jgi:hypothetical protein